jgi:hypothetical protein
MIMEVKMDKRLRAYLAGGIERAPDRGVEWRRAVAELMEAEGLPVETVNPLDFEMNRIMRLINIPQEQKIQVSQDREWAFQVDPGYLSAAKELIRLDLDAIYSCDFIIALYDRYVAAGTPGELTYANDYDMPIITMVPEGDLELLPLWIIGLSDYIIPYNSTCLVEAVSQTVEHLRGDL